jgi:1-acyl-sn-glycerol-3-phosphate acyltransferase
MEPTFRAIGATAKSWFKIMGYDIRIVGDQHIPLTGGAVLAINHAGYLDFIFAGLAVYNRGRETRYLAKREIWENRYARFIMNRAKHVPVDRDNDPAKALASAIDVLKRGEVIGMFPESTIDTSFVVRKGKTGAVRMSQLAQVPLIPAAVWGAHRILTKYRPRNMSQRKIAVVVNIGEPHVVPAEADPYEATDDLLKRINNLVIEAQEMYPQKPSGPDDMWWLPAHLGGTAPTPEEADRLAAEAKAKRKADSRREPEGSGD